MRFLTLFFSLLLTYSCSRNCNEDIILKDFTNEELRYFNDIALNLELEQKSSYNLCFWTRDVRIKIYGDCNYVDSLEIIKIIEELNDLIDPIEIKLVSKRENLEIYFIDRYQFVNYAEIAINYIGYFRVYWNKFFPKGYILIDKNQPDIIRKHVLREEITQSLGLMNDTWQFPESIFYQGPPDITQYSDIDRKLIKLLYNYNLPFYMKSEEFRSKFLNNE